MGTTTDNSEPRQKSYFRVPRLRSNRTKPMPTDKKTPAKLPLRLSSKKLNPLALRETAKGEIYQLSTINDTGAYMPPSPSEDCKRDHWLDINHDALTFPIIPADRLTTSSGIHRLHTPSIEMMLQQA